MKKNLIQKITHPKERGQLLVILALAFVGLVAIVGLVVDLGYMYVSYSRLRQAVDSDALAASSQFRKNYTVEGLVASAQQFLILNKVTNTTDISIDTCDTTKIELNPDGALTYPGGNGDPVLCAVPLRKIVRVSVSEDVPLFFLSIIGLNSVPIKVTTVSEAASVDLILLIDTSESMAFGDATHPVAKGSPMRDPYQCNLADPTGAEDGYPGNCQPFQAIKDAASQLTEELFEGYDRVGIVTFNQFPNMVLPLTTDFQEVRLALNDLTVYEGVGQCPYSHAAPLTSYLNLGGPCRRFETMDISSYYWGFDCPMYYPGVVPGVAPEWDPSHCGTTNIGGGMAMASNALAAIYPTGVTAPPIREDALWVVILLTDGAANAGYDSARTPYAICPDYTWPPVDPPVPFCRDQDARPTLPLDTTYTDNLGNVITITNPTFKARHVAFNYPLYDADDYARDMVDATSYNNNTLIFTIGLGNLVKDTTAFEAANNRPPSGETLLKYAADKGRGFYYFAPGGDQLAAIFNEIGNKIATRLTR